MVFSKNTYNPRGSSTANLSLSGSSTCLEHIPPTHTQFLFVVFPFLQRPTYLLIS